ncbi:MAG: hypothetical protein O2856_15890 [Planctomycetota bacterium]|nr:hypothetical protein [Planctomycetota bacterium]
MDHSLIDQGVYASPVYASPGCSVWATEGGWFPEFAVIGPTPVVSA